MTANLLARPHVLALPLAAAWGAGLIAARDRGRAPPLGLAALMTPWANMHGGFIFGLMLIGPFALEAVTEAPAGARLLAARAWATFALAAFAAALINPYGVDALLLPFRLMSVENLSRISEWRPQDFSHVGTMELALLALLGLTLTRPFTMPPIRAALLIALVAMALQHSRHQVLLGILAPMLLARPIAAAIGAGRVGEEGRQRRAHRAAGDRRGGAGDRRRAAHGADRADGRRRRADLGLKRGPAGIETKARAERLCVSAAISSLSMCGRSSTAARNSTATRCWASTAGCRAGDAAAVENTLKRYDIAWTIFAPDSRIVAILDHEPGWRRLYADATAVVHVRDAAP